MSYNPWNKIAWNDEMLEVLRKNWDSKTNAELAAMLGLRLTSVRTKLYELGLKRMEMEYWTEEQVKYLKDNYLKMGDTELAEYFNNTWKKEKGWTKKHIEKKRRYLKLKRSADAKAVVHHRNKASGRLAVANRKRWEKTGVMPDGTIRYWRLRTGHEFPFVKVDGVWKHWNRVTWEAEYGPIPAGYNVVFRNGDARDLRLENLEVLTDEELSKRNAEGGSVVLSDNYVLGIMRLPDELKEAIKGMPELIELKRNLLKTKRIIRDERERDHDERH
ncbi:HNH endonuclease signature motif containing protein [Lacihabitans soyangensis]|uniref:HNH endonuclease n=1 Tax=Lacihabitans soyangensis TaxID=869394 RepID=A0AAE3H2R0_9BACT|nr:HNH endonuclease signature motif containing protein [Lacihabitans soyangensis]MCP9763828.1 HNH endonuclease [Lacihabitans soyangensis]